jgi:hypothetical protein
LRLVDFKLSAGSGVDGLQVGLAGADDQVAPTYDGSIARVRSQIGDDTGAGSCHRQSP